MWQYWVICIALFLTFAYSAFGPNELLFLYKGWDISFSEFPYHIFCSCLLKNSSHQQNVHSSLVSRCLFCFLSFVKVNLFCCHFRLFQYSLHICQKTNCLGKIDKSSASSLHSTSLFQFCAFLVRMMIKCRLLWTLRGANNRNSYICIGLLKATVLVFWSFRYKAERISIAKKTFPLRLHKWNFLGYLDSRKAHLKVKNPGKDENRWPIFFSDNFLFRESKT